MTTLRFVLGDQLSRDVSALQDIDRVHQHVGSTVLMVTHSLEIAAQTDRVLRLEAGQLREFAP
jgi:ABC-type lipoprotein export system ATPase subunit